MRKHSVLATLALLLILLMVGSVGAQSGPDQLPPHVIDVWPYPGEEVPATEPVVITFDQPMDRASVESSWQMDPAATGQFTWQDDQTVSFLPDGGWQRATRYEIALGTGALATNGLALEDAYNFYVQTVGILNVSAAIPAPDAEGVAADATITVSFNRPVVPLVSTEQLADLPQPLTFDPPIEGTGEWLNTSIYMFTPSQPLSGGTTFTTTVNAGLTDVTGSTLDESYTWQFKTLSPEILSVSPYQGETNVRLENTITVQFSQPMDKPSTEEAFMLQKDGNRVPGTITWSEDGMTLIFTPDPRLDIDSVYIISVAPTARSASGEATIEQGINYAFNTVPYPGISQTYPSNGEQGVQPGGGVTIYFRSLMNADTFEGKAQIVTPEGVTWEPYVYSDVTDSFTMSFAMEPETQYTITFLRGAEDVYGNAIDTDYTFSFTTGRIEPQAWLPASNQFSLTNAYRENTRIALGATAKPTVGFRLYRLDESEAWRIIQGYAYVDEMAAIRNVAEPVREWSQELDTGVLTSGSAEVFLSSESGGQLPTGIYYLEADLPTYEQPDWMGLGVVTANLTVKRGPEDILVWVTDINSAQPAAGIGVQVYTMTGQVIASGETDENGLFRSPIEGYTYDSLYAVAEGQDVYGVWSSWSTSELEATSIYVYTDRPIYRPGEKVYFRAALRDRDDMTYSLPQASTVHVVVDVNWGQQILLETDLPVSEFGTINGEFQLPEDVPLGTGTITVNYGASYGPQSTFTIAEFRVPEYKMEVTADNSEITQGDPIRAIAAAAYYFGGPVSSANLTWTAYGEPAWFNYTGPGNYAFTDYDQDYFWYQLDGKTEITDANGQVLINVINTQPPSIRPMNVTIESTVQDESGQYISGRTTVLVHPADVYVGMRTDRYFGTEGEPITVDLIAVTPDSSPIAGQNIDLEVVETRWERTPIEGQFGQYTWQQSDIPVETGSVTTGDDGTAQYTFTPPNGGIFRVRASVMDQRERTNMSGLHLWVMGSTPVWWGEPSNQIDLVADKDSYQPGDTAEILIPTPFTGESYVLVTTQRANIQSAEVFRVEGSTLVYHLPITEDHVPTIHVSAVLIKGMDEENLNPSFRTGEIALNVTPVNRRLSVVVTPSATLAQPGDTVTFDVQTTDPRGEPVSAEVGLVLTDQAILSLASPNSAALEDYFYGSQGNYIYTRVSIEGLLDSQTDDILKQQQEREAAAAPMAAEATMAPSPTGTAMAMDSAGGGGGGGGPTQVEIREDFQQTPLWAPRVVTDQTGKATVSVTLPDNLTTWALDARGLTADTLVGDTTLNVVSTLPLLVRPVAPRFFVVGDRVRLASVINNNTSATQDVQATLQAEGVTFESDETQTVSIEAGQRARVEWTVVVEDVPYVDLTFIAIGADGYQDASKPTLATGPDGTIPVYRYTAPDTVGTGGLLREDGSRTEAISLPPRLDTDQGELVVHLDPSLAVTTVDALDYLENFPHQCIEQTVSRFLPNIMTYRALKDLGIDDPELAANLQVVLDQALVKLANEQNPDGGWGWFGGMESNPYITAYAALGLIEARDAGFTVDASMIDRALNYVRTDVVRPTIDTPEWELNRQAFYLYVFARAGSTTTSELDQLLDHRLDMDIWSRAFLLMAYHEIDPENPAVDQLVSDLQTAAILSATGAHWEEDDIDWWNWSSDTRSTAMALTALTRVQPDNPILPNVVRWLMVARQGDHWETTQETAWAIMALTDWMVSTNELQGNYTYGLTLNGESLTEGTVTPDTVRDGQVLRVQVRDLLADQVNRVTFIRGEGEGVLYYTAHLNLRLWASEAKPISRGISVSREYFLEGSDESVTGATMGDVITVRVTITAPQDVYYFVLEDPIPAGTEGIDTSLLTTSQLQQTPDIQPTYDPFWWWGWWIFDRTEMRDEQVNLYADFLPTGTYVYTYQIRATVPGEFQTMPSHAYAFYFPEVFGRGAGTLFTITDSAE